MKSFTEIAMFLYRKREVAAITPPLTIFREIKTMIQKVQWLYIIIDRFVEKSIRI